MGCCSAACLAALVDRCHQVAQRCSRSATSAKITAPVNLAATATAPPCHCRPAFLRNLLNNDLTNKAVHSLPQETDEKVPAHGMRLQAGLNTAESHMPILAAPSEAGSTGGGQSMTGSSLAAPCAVASAAIAGTADAGCRRLPATAGGPVSYRRSLRKRSAVLPEVAAQQAAAHRRGLRQQNAVSPEEAAQEAAAHRRGLRQWGFANLGDGSMSTQPPPCRGSCMLGITLGIACTCLLFIAALCVCGYWCGLRFLPPAAQL